MYLEQLPDYRDEIMSGICQSDDIINLLRPENDPNMPIIDMQYKYIFPYDHMVNTTTEAGAYLCFDIDVPRVIDRTFVDLTIYIWIIVHERYMRMPDGLRLDKLGIAIEQLMNGSKDYGLGTVELKSFTRLNPAEQFHGRALVYKTVDFNRP